MTNDLTQPSPKRNVLSESKRATILSLLANGSSRRIAARVVGCSPSTITRTAARDPDFAAKLALAEQNVEIQALRYLRNTAKKERYWRANTWLLERKNPDDFAPRRPATFTPENVARIFSELGELMAGSDPEGNYTRAIEKLERLFGKLDRDRQHCPDLESAELTEHLADPDHWDDEDESGDEPEWDEADDDTPPPDHNPRRPPIVGLVVPLPPGDNGDTILGKSGPYRPLFYPLDVE